MQAFVQNVHMAFIHVVHRARPCPVQNLSTTYRLAMAPALVQFVSLYTLSSIVDKSSRHVGSAK